MDEDKIEELKDQLIAEGWKTSEEAHRQWCSWNEAEMQLALRTTQLKIVAGIFFVVVLFQILPILATAWGW